MQSALHQHARAAQRDRFVDLRADFVNRAHVCIRRPWPSIESAEGADHVAHVCVVYVPVDDVSDNVARVAALANLVSSRADSGKFVRLKESRAFSGSHALASEDAIQDRLNV